MVGETLGHYRILEKLGGGGMGDVYRAEDTQLGREIALKVLRPEVASSPERRKRFEREARSLAALSHPGIVTVFSVEQAEGVDFLTMELVRGKPLSRLIPRGGLPLGELFALALPLTEAVAAAHDHGIVHRDLKPDNVMVDEEARVKVLDFGLAKLRQEFFGTVDSRLPTETDTAEGRILGTVAYMSPEQAEGRAVDQRSDVFALGVVLYEVATGERPFKGDSSSALLAAILKDTPVSVTDLRPELPRELGRILKRALAKDPEERIQSAKELRNELRELKAEVDSGEAVMRPVEKPRTGSFRLAWWAWAGVAAAVVVGGLLRQWLGRVPEKRGPATVTPLTSDTLEEYYPELSPDGKLLALLRSDDGGAVANLYVTQVSGGEPLHLARDVLSRGAWSPDSDAIAFIHRAGVQRGEAAPAEAGSPEDRGAALAVSVIPALGGRPRQVATLGAVDGELDWDVDRGLDWSPDGEWFVFNCPADHKDLFGLCLLSLETGETRTLTHPPAISVPGDASPRFSPDGRTVAFLRGFLPHLDIYLVPAAGGEPNRLTHGNWRTDGLDWTADGRSIVFSSCRSPRGAVFSLWKVPVVGGEPRPLEFGESGHDPSVSRTGDRLAYEREISDMDIWRVGGPNAPKDERKPRPFISSTSWDWAPEYSPDGKTVLFTSHRSGFGEVWLADADGSNARQLTHLDDAVTTTGNGWSTTGGTWRSCRGSRGTSTSTSGARRAARRAR
jgi:Tol biopolymer transport system component